MIQPVYSYPKSLFYKIWLVICSLIIIATVASSFLVYLQISAQLKTHMEQRLLWEANFYRQQLEAVLLRTAQKLDSLVRTSGAATKNDSLLLSEMNTIHIQSPSVIRCWIAYPDGTLIPSPYTRPDYVRTLPWWKDYLSGKTPEGFMGFLMERCQSLIGKPIINQSDLTTLIPLLSVSLDGTRIVRAAGAQMELNSVLTDNAGIDVDWSNIPVSVYTNEGVMVACPFRYYRYNSKLGAGPSSHPLIRQMLQNPNEIKGFGIYTNEGRKMAGVYLKAPTLGMVLTVEYPATEVVDPVRRIASGPLIIAALLLLVATFLMITIYSNTKRLRQIEKLARSAELRALQAHINPHFLFNTLNCLVGLAVTTGNASLVKMIRSLINIFRYTIRNLNESVTLKEELDYLAEYVSIQQLRYGKRFSFNLSVPDELLDAKIFKFCIQPLVENCFVHGVEKSLDPVLIKVEVSSNENEIDIRVFDNGPGVSDERLAEIKRSLQSETYDLGKQGNSVGLSNIHHRLRYAYGYSYGISIESTKEGFAVHLKIPY